jgi:hypothetical protein
MSEPPKINLTPKRSYQVVFSGVAALGPNVGTTLIAGPVNFRYRVKNTEVVFRDDAANLLWTYSHRLALQTTY